jgi:beta-phosphoglucomutase-like phosphatase (HAD superfamily)
VVSASENCDVILSRAGLLGLFDARVTGIEAAALHLAGKPAPDTFLKAAELLDTAPARAAVFEDAISGVQAGRAGGFGLVVGVDRRGEGKLLAENGADVVTDDLRRFLPPPAANTP